MKKVSSYENSMDSESNPWMCCFEHLPLNMCGNCMTPLHTLNLFHQSIVWSPSVPKFDEMSWRFQVSYLVGSMGRTVYLPTFVYQSHGSSGIWFHVSISLSCCQHEGLLTFAVHDEGCKQWPGSGIGHRLEQWLKMVGTVFGATKAWDMEIIYIYINMWLCIYNDMQLYMSYGHVLQIPHDMKNNMILFHRYKKMEHNRNRCIH